MKMKDSKENVINILEKISDLEFQKNVWLKGEYWDKVSSFEEAINTLDDYYFFSDIKSNVIGLTQDEKNKVEIFIKELLAFEMAIGETMLKDEKWISIADTAKDIIVILKKYNW